MQDLTKQQRKVFQLVQQGHSNRTIAERCDLTVGTVKQHLHRAFRKMGVKTRLEAMVLKIKRPKGV